MKQKYMIVRIFKNSSYYTINGKEVFLYKDKCYEFIELDFSSIEAAQKVYNDKYINDPIYNKGKYIITSYWELDENKSSNNEEAKNWLKSQLNNLIIDTNDSKYLRYKKGNETYLWYDDKNNKLYINYWHLWVILERDYHLKYDEIEKLCSDMVSDTLKLNINSVYYFM